MLQNNPLLAQGDAGGQIENLPVNLELDLLYSYDGAEGKTLTNFDCGDANLLLVYFDPYAPSQSNNSIPAIIYRQNGSQIVSAASDYNFLTVLTFLPTGIFSQLAQQFEPTYGTNHPTQDNTRMVVRRIYSIKGFKAQGASGPSEASCPYEVGDILQTKNAAPPSERWPGTEWAAIETFLLGASTEHTAGSTGGEERHTLTVAEMPEHYHDKIFTHDVNDTVATAVGNDAAPGTGRRDITYTTGSRSFYTSKTGGSQPHNNMPPYTTVYIWERIA